ncbi:GDSL-type esterase/lipase family protein [Streptomyces noboritoensis]|uniref:GDSL-type esterase/lipase family protein n=1 Tax=Streptomyces noboritoensis TaxID=67337 RepID=A0ABV6TCB7_9ACTN
MNDGESAASAERRSRRSMLLWWGPRVMFVGGAVVLVVESSRGVPLPELRLALCVFGVCSAVFIARQLWVGHQRGPGGDAPRWLVRAAAFLTAAGVLVLVAHLAGVKGDALPLVGSVLLLLGLGWFVEAWRGAKPGQPRKALLWWGVALCTLTAVTAIAAAFLLPKAKGGLFLSLLVALGLGLFVALPLGVNVLSEWGVRRLRRRSSAAGDDAGVGIVGYLGLAGIVLAVLAVVCLGYLDWVLAAVLVATALVLVLAVVSNTHADIALVLAALCMLAVAPPERPTPQALIPAGGQRVLVAIGDSYMSGEGASSYFEGTDDGGRDECRRSPSAYAVALATKDRRFDRMLFLACSGARTYNVIAKADARLLQGQKGKPGAKIQAQDGEPGTQIDQLTSQTSSFRPALVIVALGGNDAGFAILGEACIAPGGCKDQASAFTGNLPKVRGALAATFRSLRKALPADVPIVAVPYPQPLAPADRCTGVALTKTERDFIHTFVDDVDQTMSDAATEAHAGIEYLAEMKDSLKDHQLQLCQGRKSKAGINFVDIASVNGFASQRFSPAKWIHNSLHPNERGHEAMRDTFTTWLNNHPGLLEHRAPTAPGQATSQALPAPEPECTMTRNAGNPHCQDRIRAWELEQTRGRWPWLLLVLLALAFLWVASIAVFSLLPGGKPPHRDPASRAARAR